MVFIAKNVWGSHGGTGAGTERGLSFLHVFNKKVGRELSEGDLEDHPGGRTGDRDEPKKKKHVG